MGLCKIGDALYASEGTNSSKGKNIISSSNRSRRDVMDSLSGASATGADDVQGSVDGPERPLNARGGPGDSSDANGLGSREEKAGETSRNPCRMLLDAANASRTPPPVSASATGSPADRRAAVQSTNADGSFVVDGGGRGGRGAGSGGGGARCGGGARPSSGVGEEIGHPATQSTGNSTESLRGVAPTIASNKSCAHGGGGGDGGDGNRGSGGVGRTEKAGGAGEGTGGGRDFDDEQTDGVEKEEKGGGEEDGEQRGEEKEEGKRGGEEGKREETEDKDEDEDEETVRRVRVAQSLAMYRAQLAAERRLEQVWVCLPSDAVPWIISFPGVLITTAVGAGDAKNG